MSDDGGGNEPTVGEIHNSKRIETLHAAQAHLENVQEKSGKDIVLLFVTNKMLIGSPRYRNILGLDVLNVTAKGIDRLVAKQREAKDMLQQLQQIGSRIPQAEKHPNDEILQWEELSRKITVLHSCQQGNIECFNHIQDGLKCEVFSAFTKEGNRLKNEEDELSDMVVEKGFPLELYCIARADLVKKVKHHELAMAMLALRGVPESLDRLGFKECGDSLRDTLRRVRGR